MIREYKYTRDMFKTELLAFCAKNYDPIAIARKVSKLFLDHQAEIDLDLRDKMLDLMTMEDSPEFEMTEKEFKKFLDKM